MSSTYWKADRVDQHWDGVVEVIDDAKAIHHMFWPEISHSCVISDSRRAGETWLQLAQRMNWQPYDPDYEMDKGL